MTTTDKAHAVIDMLYGRKGFDDWWGELPTDIKAEIITAIEDVLNANPDVA